MPFNGSGTFTIVNVFVPNTTILSAAVNQNFSDIATGLSDCLTRDGQAGMTQPLKAVSGSVSAPGITFNADATAGLYLSTTGVVGLVAKSLGLLVDSAIFQAASATVQSGGSGYAVGDTITETGGTAINQAVFVVATLSGSAVATVTLGYPGNYTVVPTNPVSQGSTSGSGSGCTLNITFVAQFSASLVTNEAGALPWQRLGSSSFVSGLMAKVTGLDYANAIGGANLAAAIGGTLVAPPKGILSPISSTSFPIPTTDQTGVTTIFWTPYNGNSFPIYNGVNFVTFSSAQMSCVLTAGAQAAAGIYDVYVFLNSGTPTLGFSPSWAAGTSGSVTAGSCARGTGAGGTALAVVNGIYVNAAQQTVNNSSSTFTVAVNQGTYLGSIYVDPSNAGKINCHVSFGEARTWGLWNAFNRQQIVLIEGDTTASWSYTTNAFRQANAAGNVNNYIDVFSGLPEENYDLEYIDNTNVLLGTGTTTNISNGIGFNSTTVPSGVEGSSELSQNSGGNIQVGFVLTARYQAPKSLGVNRAYPLENGRSSSAATWLGGNGSMQFTARWRG